MAARIRPQRALAAAMIGVGSLMALSPQVAEAETQAQVHAQAQAPSDYYQRKPIYDEDVDLGRAPQRAKPPAPSTPSSPSPVPAGAKPRAATPTDRLAVHIGRARLFLHDHVVAAEDGLNATMDSAFHLEQSFTRTVASLAPPRESGERLMPGAIYVLVAAMAGTIVARNRNIVLRVAAPLTLGTWAAWAAVPITMGNVGELGWKYEQRFPALADGHTKARQAVQDSWRTAKTTGLDGVRFVDDKVTGAREAIQGWVRTGK